MLNTFTVRDNILEKVSNEDGIPKNVMWIDLFDPVLSEEKDVERFVGVEIPTREEMREIELSNRLYRENKALYMTATILAKADTDEPENHAITFMIVDERLVTIRYVDPLPFKVFTTRIQKITATNHQGETLMTDLLEAFINRVADIMENIGRNVDNVSKQVFKHAETKTSKEKKDFQHILEEIGQNGDLISKTQESLISFLRLVGFMAQQLSEESCYDVLKRLESIRKDTIALRDHSNYLANKITFLLDATLGMINIQQNDIIKIFSVAAVAFLPPTLIASIYGMNFHHMPELDWQWGYPMAIGLMFLSAYLPYRFFKRRGWL